MSAIFGEALTFGQANGPDIMLRVFGDENYARYEDMNGYSAVYDDERGLFCYARLRPAASAPPACRSRKPCLQGWCVTSRKRRRRSSPAPRPAGCAAPR